MDSLGHDYNWYLVFLSSSFYLSANLCYAIVLQRMKVETFVSKVNAAMKERHELERLKTTAVFSLKSEKVQKLPPPRDSCNLHRIQQNLACVESPQPP